MTSLWIAAAIALAAPVDTPEPVQESGVYHPMQSFAPLIEAIRPAVVTIEVSGPNQLQDVPEELLEMFGFSPGDEPRSSGEGSGFIIAEDGLVLTNHHVVATAAELTAVLHDGSKVSATIIGGDEAMDLALLRLDGERDWPALDLGDSDALQVGDWVLALGNTLGLGTTATVGIVSGKGRVLGHDVFGQEDYIQTDAAINQGNSGGPLFDLNGRVVGMNTAIIAGANTVGFSIPANLITEALADLQEHGRITRGFLGVRPQTLDEDLRKALDVEVSEGAVVADVFDDTPASKSGLKTGDVVVEVDGTAISSDTDLIAAIAGKRPGERVELQIERDRKPQKLKVVLTERPGVDLGAPEPGPSEQDDAISGLGVVFRALPPAVAAEAGVRKGVLVERVETDSVAEGRLRPGDVVVEVNRRPVTSPDDVARQIARSSGSAFLLVIRDSAQQFVAIPLP